MSGLALGFGLPFLHHVIFRGVDCHLSPCFNGADSRCLLAESAPLSVLSLPNSPIGVPNAHAMEDWEWPTAAIHLWKWVSDTMMLFTVPIVRRLYISVPPFGAHKQCLSLLPTSSAFH